MLLYIQEIPLPEVPENELLVFGTRFAISMLFSLRMVFLSISKVSDPWVEVAAEVLSLC